MKFFFPLFIFLASCSQSQNIKINLKTKNILDLSIDPSNVLYLCSTPGDPSEPRTFFTVYSLNPDGVDTFYTRRAMTLKECHKWIKETDLIMKGAKTCRVVGLSGKESSFSDEDLKRKTKGKYEEVKSLWLFSRIVTDKGCVGHFGRECEPGFDERKLFTNP